jgi:hypothetical protein
VSTDIIGLIDAAIGCGHCGGDLAGSVSEYYCGEACQEGWNAGRGEALPVEAPMISSAMWRRALWPTDRWWSALRTRPAARVRRGQGVDRVWIDGVEVHGVISVDLITESEPVDLTCRFPETRTWINVDGEMIEVSGVTLETAFAPRRPQ